MKIKKIIFSFCTYTLIFILSGCAGFSSYSSTQTAIDVGTDNCSEYDGIFATIKRVNPQYNADLCDCIEKMAIRSGLNEKETFRFLKGKGCIDP